MSYFLKPPLESQQLSFFNQINSRLLSSGSSDDSSSTAEMDTSSTVSTPSADPDIILPSIAPTAQEKIAAISLLSLVHGKFPDNTPLMQNLRFAKQINDYVKRAVPFAANNDFRGKAHTQHLDKKSFEAFSTKMTIAYGQLCEKMEISDDEDPTIDLIQNWHEYAELIEKAKIGNCRELSIAGFRYGVEELKLKNIEIIQILDGDHAFLVIGRDKKSKPENFRDWGASAVVCDPWSESFYPATKILDHLKDYKGYNEVDGKAVPNVAPFDPLKQELDLLLSSDDVYIG